MIWRSLGVTASTALGLGWYAFTGKPGLLVTVCVLHWFVILCYQYQEYDRTNR